MITAPVTAFATTLEIQRCGVILVFADIDPATACLNPASVERCISPLTKAVLVVHLSMAEQLIWLALPSFAVATGLP